ncbi:hypothetical protein [Pontibacillus marinus]|uniref:Uncharacterized protein n=1 Tax=Pontibacillus marinus BH030004 = DSM 16465 TaxID=1385511 RepID=A0A0A5G7V0_9BACI|nr:hypothetical protein [Pontibacillus marinus]KGX87253.1 hypothetical protein N783_09985 [Pontibacillus marinus BH030004 = DSM 16465]
MLSVELHTPESNETEKILKSNGFQESNGHMVYKPNKQEQITVILNKTNQKITLTFSPQLNLEQFTTIHQKIMELIQCFDSKYDDSNSLLGYLKDGEGAYIITNWSKWYKLLQDARLKTLEGQKVRILDQKENELGSGIFVDYKRDTEHLTIIECSIITLFGEKAYSGTNLKIEPTNEW